MKKVVHLFLTASFLGTISCKTVLYVPNTPNIPLLSQKGEIRGKVAAGINDVEPQISIALTNHIAIMANTSFNFPDSASHSLKRNFWEGAIGYYTPIEDSKFGIFETYIGYGRGHIFGNYSYLNDKTNGWYNRFFIQPNIGMRTKNLEIGVCMRLTAVNFHKTFPNKESTGFNYFMEPSVVLRAGFQRFKFDFQIGASGNSNGLYSDSFPHDPLILSLGFQFTIGGKKFEKF